jgi:hypothetical protein
LRASIIAAQRSAVMGYSNCGSDACGYNQQLLELEVCGRWLAFSAFTPIMEVGLDAELKRWFDKDQWRMSELYSAGGNMRRNSIAILALVLLFGAAESSVAQVMRVQMHIAGYLCGN